MNILLIGNGFDLAHKLPTKYTDFLKFVQAYNKFKVLYDSGNLLEELNNVSDEEKDYFIYLEDLCENNQNLFCELNELISENVWIIYFNNIFKQQEEIGKDGWIDFESEISKIIQALDSARKEITAKIINEGAIIARISLGTFKILKPILVILDKDASSQKGYKLDIISLTKGVLLTSLEKLTRCLEIYLCDFVERFFIKKYTDNIPRLDNVEEMQIDGILSFNYTEVYQKLYDDKESLDYNYIHGKADINHSLEDCNLILGIDEYLNDYERNFDNEFVQFKKFYQRIYKQTGSDYLDWISEHEREETNLSLEPGNLYIIGHSLNVTDKDILEKLIMAPNMTTTIFYHNKEALGKQIANLIKVIGEGELIKRVHGEFATIFFKELK